MNFPEERTDIPEYWSQGPKNDESQQVEMDLYVFGNWTSNFTASSNPSFLWAGLNMHPHWRQYKVYIDQIPDAVFFALGIYIAVIGIIGFIGNFCVIYIFTKTQTLRTPANMFLVSVAMSDLLFSVLNGFPFMTVSCFKRVWFWGQTTCEVYGFLAGLFGLNSLNTLAWISFDRRNAIARPFDSLKNNSHRKTALKIAFIWFWALLWSAPPLLGWGRYVAEGLQTSCTFDYLTQDASNFSFNQCLYVFSFYVPLTVIIISYINIISVVRGRRQANNDITKGESIGASKSRAELGRKQEMRTTKIAAGTVSLYLISWVPYAVIAHLGIFGYRQFITPYSAQIPVMLAKASATWNPILYALTHPRFQKALLTNFPCLKLFMKTSKPSSSRESRPESRRNDKESSDYGSSEPAMSTQVSLDSPDPASSGNVFPTVVGQNVENQLKKNSRTNTNTDVDPNATDISQSTLATITNLAIAFGAISEIQKRRLVVSSSSECENNQEMAILDTFIKLEDNNQPKNISSRDNKNKQ